MLLCVSAISIESDLPVDTPIEFENEIVCNVFPGAKQDKETQFVLNPSKPLAHVFENPELDQCGVIAILFFPFPSLP